MKEMIYQKEPNREKVILDKGFFKDYEYIILNLGTHPCAYICLDANSKFYQKQYGEIPIDVHGGVTFSEDKLYRVLEYSDEDGEETLQTIERDWIIGWDYNHFNDCNGSLGFCGRKYTTKEIKQEVEEAINQLIALEGD